VPLGVATLEEALSDLPQPPRAATGTTIVATSKAERRRRERLDMGVPF
jgi:hypothetical protein